MEFGQFTRSLGELVEGNDHHPYVKNPFCQKPTGSYLKLEACGGDTLMARLPQAISVEDGNTTYAMRLVLKVVGEEFTYIPDTLADHTVDAGVKFVWRNDSRIQINKGYGAFYRTSGAPNE
ncbi:MAG: hypothetical protein PUH24_06740 [Prevotellaceae bacterium]|nr:hypothetical protein [Prevotella sp.]MDD7257944.1 hypothetical protein [Prevotellaceae bacterium]MDY6129855.1 hypothetical protein [Prevotella sp.]